MGADLGLNNTGIVILNRAGEVTWHDVVGTDPDELLEERIEWISSMVLRYAQQPKTLVAVERGVHGGRFTDSRTWELAGVVKNKLYTASLPFILLTPPSVKKFATGNGRASKKQMVAAAAAAGFVTKIEDEADAYWIAQMCRSRTMPS